MPGLETGRIDKHILRMLARQDTVNAVPSRLRLARDNGYFAAYQGIGQCGFTDIGPPDNSDEPAMERFRHFLSRSEEHTSELQSLMRISYAVFCLKKKNQYIHNLQITYRDRDKVSDTDTIYITNSINIQINKKQVYIRINTTNKLI